MPVPAPRLDDRSFQQLVDESKRLVQRRCQEWTDHNVSDPGVTLIEAFAYMVDQLIYRLNRVPDRHYVKFLELIGLDLLPPTAARGQVTFWLSAAQPQPVVVRQETEVATPRTDVEDPMVFTTTEALNIVPCSFSHAAAAPAVGPPVDESGTLDGPGGFNCFAARPVVGDALLIGLSNPVPRCAVLLRLDCQVEGVGVDPRRPPLVWEAWTGSGWERCDLDHDRTGGLNRPGDVVLHVPADHQASIVARQRAAWLRCRLVAPLEGQPTYTASPRIKAVSAATIGGTGDVVNAEMVRDELLGASDGTPAQRFRLRHSPVVPATDAEGMRVSADGGWEEWSRVEHFAESGPEDRHYRLEPTSGEVETGPAVREVDGSVRQYGAIPANGATLVLSAYRTGGGRRGNVARGQIRVLKTSVPYVARVENRVPAAGGAEAERVEDAKVRGPLLLRSRGRAVTAEDFETLSRAVAPDAARVECLPAGSGAETHGVRVLVVPHVFSDELGRVRREDLDPPDELLERISRQLDERRLVGSRVVVEPPDYQGLTAVVSATARPSYRPEDVRGDVLRTLYRWFHPLLGGPAGTGWPLGNAVRERPLLQVLAQVPGIDIAEATSVEFFAADPTTGRRTPTPALELRRNALAFSYEHQVRVQR